MNYCKYGCGKEGIYIFKNKSYCCSDSPNKCPQIRSKNSIKIKESRKIEKENGTDRSKNLKRIPCRYCNKIVTTSNINKHEPLCYLNPINIKICPVCESPIRYKDTATCSQKCCQIHFRGMFNEVRKTRDMSWANGHSTTFICFTHHKKECIICKENVIVSVHHYDNNHSNDNPENLVPLCPTHHMYMHSQYIYLIKECVDEYIEKFKTHSGVAQLE